MTYKCDICSKEYTSQKRYLVHVEKCQNREDTRSNEERPSSSRSRSVRSIGSTRSLDISDVEDDRRSSRSVECNRDSLEKLIRQNEKLKIENKKFVSDIRHMNREHREQLSQNEDYFRDQITALSEERDQLVEQITSVQEKLFNEKDKLRSDFAKKLTTEKKRLEQKYIGLGSNQVSKLTDTIKKLQEKQGEYFEEKEDLEQQLEAKHDEIIHLKSLLKNSEQSLSKTEVRYVDKERQLQTLRTEHETHRLSFEKQISELQTNIRFLKDSHAKKLEDNNRINQRKITQEVTEKTQSIQKEHDNRLITIHQDFEKKIRELSDELDKQKNNVSHNQNLIDECVTRKEHELTSQFIIEIDKFECEICKLKDVIVTKDKTISELERVNIDISEKSKHIREAMKRMKNDTDSIKEQFVFNLNKQKEDGENAIIERETRIDILEKEINDYKNNIVQAEKELILKESKIHEQLSLIEHLKNEQVKTEKQNRELMLENERSEETYNVNRKLISTLEEEIKQSQETIKLQERTIGEIKQELFTKETNLQNSIMYIENLQNDFVQKINRVGEFSETNENHLQDIDKTV